MIAFFPDVYPDELVYSWLARYGVRSGYSHYRAIADDLFTSNTAKPNLEFIMELSQDAIKAMTSSMSLENIVLKHTMFPYYARFLPAERRQKAFRLLINMDNSFNDALYSRRFKTQHRQWLRYCPICAEEDRSRYGETYWHRQHQLDHVDICPAHGCRLHDSTVSITSKASPSLIHAEIVIPESADTTFDNNPIEIKVAQYVSQVFNADIDFANPITHGRFLHHKMEYTKYLSTRGVKRLLTPLYEDFSTYYCDLPNLTITEPWHLEKLFSNYQCHTYDICLLAIFLGVPVSDLTHMALPIKSQTEMFDEQILHLHEQGLNYRQISKRMDASYDYCKLVAKRNRIKAST